MRWPWLVMLCACGDNSAAVEEDLRQQVVEIPANRDLDMLFVIDGSGGSPIGFTYLKQAFEDFYVHLDFLTKGDLPSLHVGVASTDMGTKGTAVMTPGPNIQFANGSCRNMGDDGVLFAPVAGTTDGANFLRDIKNPDGTRTRNIELTFGFSNTNVDASCPFSQPLHSMRRALENTTGNAGFLRPTAGLAIVFLGHRDDCSFKDPALVSTDTTLGPLSSFRCAAHGITCAGGGQTSTEMYQPGSKSGCEPVTSSNLIEDLGTFRDYLVSLKGTRLWLAGILAPSEPVVVLESTATSPPTIFLDTSCMDVDPITQFRTGGQPAVRMRAFLDMFPSQATMTSICQRSYKEPLEDFATQIAQSFGDPCLTQPIASSDCIVEDVSPAGAIAYPECGDPEVAPCWRLDVDPKYCTEHDHFRLVMLRKDAPDPAAVTKMRCPVPAARRAS